jgi:hypothetical protein
MDASGIDRISFLFFLRITNFFVPFTNSLFGGCCDVKNILHFDRWFGDNELGLRYPSKAPR